MSVRYDIFECDGVQLRTRRRVYRLGSAGLVALMLTIALAVLHQRGTVATPLLGSGLLIVWASATTIASVQFRRLRRIVWCLKVSETDLVGYDFARRRLVLAWEDVRRVEMDDDGLRLVGADGRRLVVPHRFGSFSALSHRVVAIAEALGIPVHLNGQPWQALDVYTLYPFLAEDPSADASDARQT